MAGYLRVINKRLVLLNPKTMNKKENEETGPAEEEE